MKICESCRWDFSDELHSLCCVDRRFKTEKLDYWLNFLRNFDLLLFTFTLENWFRPDHIKNTNDFSANLKASFKFTHGFHRALG